MIDSVKCIANTTDKRSSSNDVVEEIKPRQRKNVTNITRIASLGCWSRDQRCLSVTYFDVHSDVYSSCYVSSKSVYTIMLERKHLTRNKYIPHRRSWSFGVVVYIDVREASQLTFPVAGIARCLCVFWLFQTGKLFHCHRNIMISDLH